MTSFPLITIAICLGAVAVMLGSALDFHAPHRVSEIRYAVLPERYWFAIVVYSTIAVFFYFMVLNFIFPLVFYLTPVPDAVAGLALAIPATIAFVVLAPRLPLLRGGIRAVRRATQSLARYPQTVETLTAIISRAPFAISERAVMEVVGELERYGVSPKLIDNALADNNKVLTVGAATMIQQICSLHISFHELRNVPRFEKFFLARKSVFDRLENQYRQLLRRSARALLIADDLSMSSQDSEDLALEISDFIAEECEDLRESYLRLLAEATLSGASTRAARTSLIFNFGYRLSLPNALPFWPLIVIFALDFLSSVAPILFLTNLPPEFKVSPRAAGLAAAAHAFGLTISVLFAIYPKMSTNFARPSLFALPWRSYMVFGLASYLVGNAALYLTYSTIDLSDRWPAHSHPFATSTLFSLIFLINTVVLSILLDIRLRNASVDYHDDRFRDGMTLAVVMTSLMFILIVGFLQILAVYGMKLPPVPWEIYALSVLSCTALGFVMGYLVPSTAEAYIDANRLTLQWTEQEGLSIGWATQQYRPEAKSVS
jgi:hypothetical protein